MSTKAGVTGADIKRAIKGAGYTMEDAAAKLGITRQTLHNHIGRAKIDSEFLQNVKSALQIEIDTGIKAPETYDELLEIYRIAVKQMEARIKEQEKLIAVLEDRAAKR